jgi:hypothetical protein
MPKNSAKPSGPHPCKSGIAASARLADAVADGRPHRPRAVKPVPQLGSPSVVPPNPNSRLGRKRARLRKEGIAMEQTYVGIDVSKDRLDVHVRPGGQAFAVSRDGKGLEELVDRLRTHTPMLIVVEATGGFETVVAAAIGGAQLPLVVANPAQVRHFAQAVGKRAKTDPIDAEMIARFAEAVKPTPHQIPDEAARLLGELVGPAPANHRDVGGRAAARRPCWQYPRSQEPGSLSSAVGN